MIKINLKKKKCLQWSTVLVEKFRKQKKIAWDQIWAVG